MEIQLFFYSNVNNDEIKFQLSNELDFYLAKKKFGDGLKRLNIGIVCADKMHEKFYKVSRPKFISGNTVIKKFGISLNIEDAFFYDIKIDFNIFIESDVFARKKMVLQEIFNSLILLRPKFKKIKDFDFETFVLEFSDFSTN